MAKIQLTKSGGNFEIAPEGNGKAVCVDVTPLELVQTQFGPKEKFRLVFELDESAFGVKQDGERFAVWSSGFTPSVHERSSLTKFLRGWFGKSLPTNLEEFDVETLIGRPAFIVVTHSVSETDSKIEYANIAACTADNSGAPLKPSGKFIRKENREKKDSSGAPAGTGAAWRKAEQPEDSGREDWQTCKVHVGKFAGVQLGDLEQSAVEALIAKWVPVAKAKPKPLADDKRLLAALAEAEKVIKGATDDPAGEEPPY